MKKIRPLAIFALFLTPVLLAGCNRTAVNPSSILTQGYKWTCFYYSTCPANPMSAAPCYQYKSSETAIFGDGAIFIQIGNDNTIYRTVKGNFKYTPYSYIYTQANDSLTYQQLDSSTLIILNGSQAIDTVKTTSVTDSLLVLKYVSSQFSTTVEIDSLRR